jgi:glutamate-1-semialdehyde 2,1-aminomutase
MCALGGGTHLLGGVPMTWMRMWSGGFPLYYATARGARLTETAAS